MTPARFQVYPYQPHARASVSWQLVDLDARTPSNLGSFHDDHTAAAVAELLNVYKDEFNGILAALGAKEPF